MVSQATSRGPLGNVRAALMVWLGTGGVLAPAIAAGPRVYLAAHNSNGLYDIAGMGVSLVWYASMAAVSFFEQAAEGSGHYVHSVLGILTIRDLRKLLI